MNNPDLERFRLAAAFVALLAGAGAHPTVAQPASSVPPLRSPTSPVQSNPIPSADPPRPGLTGGIDWLAGIDTARLGVPGATVLAERTFLTRRPGWLVRAGSGSVVFVPDPIDQAENDNGDPTRPPPMRLMPSLELERIESSLGDQTEPARFALTGQVFVYNGRNHLMPTAAAPTSEPEPEPEPGPEPADNGQQNDAQQPAENPSIDDIVRQIRDAEGEAEPGLGAAANVAPDPANDGQEGRDQPPLPEGAYLSQRRARLVREPGGRLTVAIDNDTPPPGQPGETGEPVTSPGSLALLPCTLTESLSESLELVRNEPVLLISGRVYVYRGKSYLLPTIYRFERPTGVDPRQ